MADDDGRLPQRLADQGLLPGPRRRQGRHGRRDQEGLPQARARQPPRLQPRRHRQARPFKRSPRPTTSSATPRSARSTTRCAPLGPAWRRLRAASAGRRRVRHQRPAARARRTGRRRLRRHVRRPLRRRLPVAPAPRPTAADQGRRRRDQRRPSAFTDAIDGVTISAAADLRRRLPDLLGHRRQARHQAAHLPAVRGRRLRRVVGRRRVLAQRDLPRLRWPPARLRRGVPDLPRLRPRPVRAHDPGADPGRGQGRPADPAARQGRGGRARRPGRRPLRHRQGEPAPAVRPQGRQPHARRTRLLRRGRAGRGHQDPDARRGAGHPQDPGRARPTAAPSGSAARAPARPTAPTATCWRPSRCRCPLTSTPTAREAVEAYRAATSGKPLRANLFEAS